MRWADFNSGIALPCRHNSRFHQSRQLSWYPEWMGPFLLRPTAAAASNDCFWEALLTRLRYDDRGFWPNLPKIDLSSFSAVISYKPWVINIIHISIVIWKTMVKIGMKRGVTFVRVECIRMRKERSAIGG